MNKKWAVAAGAMSAVLIPAGVAGAEVKIASLAPISTAESTAANVAGLLGIGHTEAETGPATGTATGNALELGNTPLVGGTQDGVGSTSGALLDTKQTPLGRVEVAPWAASVTQSGNKTNADSSAALARANVINPDTISIDLLQSVSSTQWENLLSQAFSSSDAAVLRIGGADGLTIKILHAESSSNGTGLSYILSINDKPVVSIDELGKQLCALDVTGLLELSCLTVSGNVGSTLAQVVGIAVGGPNGLTADAIKATGSGGVGSVVNVPGAPAVQGVNFTKPAPAASTNSAMPRTGINLGFMVAAAMALLALGTVMVRLRSVLDARATA